LIKRRLLSVIPVLFGVSLLAFLLMTLLPGNTAELLLGAEATPAQVAQLTAELHLDRPPWERYFDWLGRVLTGDFGTSLASGQLVLTLIGERLPVTLQLVGCAFVLSLGLSVPMALLAASKPGGPVDRGVAAFSMAALSFPSYVLALVLVLIFAVKLAWFPSLGVLKLGDGVAGNLRSLALPALSIALPLAGFYTRFLRGDLLEQMDREDYVLTAVAKGLGRGRILVCHALRNSMLGLLTIVGVNIATLIGGSVIVEQIFALPGLGQLLLQSISIRDVVVVQGIVLVLAVVTVVANGVIDLLYIVVDPRIRYARD